MQDSLWRIIIPFPWQYTSVLEQRFTGAQIQPIFPELLGWCHQLEFLVNSDCRVRLTYSHPLSSNSILMFTAAVFYFYVGLCQDLETLVQPYLLSVCLSCNIHFAQEKVTLMQWLLSSFKTIVLEWNLISFNLTYILHSPLCSSLSLNCIPLQKIFLFSYLIKAEVCVIKYCKFYK